jgi:hypothetical protein
MMDPNDGTVQVVVEALTDEQNKLYLDNAKSKNKLSVHVSADILEPMLMAGGPKNAVYMMKQWFEENFGDAKVEDSLQDLIREFNELHPSNHEHAMFYIGKIDNVNARLAKINDRYKKDDLELIIAVLSSYLTTMTAGRRRTGHRSKRVFARTE